MLRFLGRSESKHIAQALEAKKTKRFETLGRAQSNYEKSARFKETPTQHSVKCIHVVHPRQTHLTVWILAFLLSRFVQTCENWWLEAEGVEGHVEEVRSMCVERAARATQQPAVQQHLRALHPRRAEKHRLGVDPRVVHEKAQRSPPASETRTR